MWRRSIFLSIFICETTHQHTIFMNSAATYAAEAAELRFDCCPSVTGEGGLCGKVYPSVCVHAPCGFL